MAKQITEDSEDNINYLKDFSTEELLEKFGAGKPVPGSGSAAAFSALLAIEMMKTVCKVTIKKDEYKTIRHLLDLFQSELENNFKPRVKELFEKDIKAFHRVIFFQRKKNQTKDENHKKDYQSKELKYLKEATKIQIQLCHICLELFDSAVAVFDKGYEKVRGDSGVAISSLLAAASSSLFIILLNLDSISDEKWFDDAKATAEDLAKRLNNFQAVGFEKILELYESLKNSDKQLKFEVFSDE